MCYYYSPLHKKESIVPFLTEYERQQHPFARLIPKAVWEDVFSNQLGELELALMNATAEDARAFPTRIPYLLLGDAEKQRCILALIFSKHSERSFWTDLSGRPEFYILLLQVLDNAALKGYLPVINRLIELAPDKMPAMLQACEYLAFRNAASSGHLPIISRLIELAPDKVQDMLGANDYEAFRHNAPEGYLPVMQRLIDELAPDNVPAMVQAYDYGAFRNAASNGHLPVMRRLIDLAPDKVQAMVQS